LDRGNNCGPLPLSEIGASAADQLALEGFAALLEGAAKQLRIASSNAEKLKDFRAALSSLGIAVVAPEKLPLDVIEDGKTYEDNALKKVRAWVAMTGQACVVDDSGIAIDALGGAPGVHSARYSGVNGVGRHQAGRAPAPQPDLEALVLAYFAGARRRAQPRSGRGGLKVPSGAGSSA
jgi:hypothetical protein